MMAKQDSLDPQTRDLVRFAAAVAQGYEPELRERVGPMRQSQVPAEWVEELLLRLSLLCLCLKRLSRQGSALQKVSGRPCSNVSWSGVPRWQDTCGTVVL